MISWLKQSFDRPRCESSTRLPRPQAMDKFYASDIQALPPRVHVQLRTGGGQLLGRFFFDDCTIAQASEWLRFKVCKQKNIPELCVFLKWTQRHNSDIEVEFRPKEINALAQDHRITHRRLLDYNDLYYHSFLCRGGPGIDRPGIYLLPCDVCCSAVTTHNAKQCSKCKAMICSSCCVEAFFAKSKYLVCFNCAYRHCRLGQALLNPDGMSIRLHRRLFLLGYIQLSDNGSSDAHQLIPRFGGTWKSYATAVFPERHQEVYGNRSDERVHKYTSRKRRRTRHD